MKVNKQIEKADHEKSATERAIKKRVHVALGAIYSGKDAIIEKHFTEIDKADAIEAHRLASAINKQMDDVMQQIHSKLHAILEIYGVEAVLKDTAGKIVFNVEISRVQDKLCNKVHHVVEID